jgi:hypothetical protein
MAGPSDGRTASFRDSSRARPPLGRRLHAEPLERLDLVVVESRLRSHGLASASSSVAAASNVWPSPIALRPRRPTTTRRPSTCQRTTGAERSGQRTRVKTRASVPVCAPAPLPLIVTSGAAVNSLEVKAQPAQALSMLPRVRAKAVPSLQANLTVRTPLAREVMRREVRGYLGWSVSR